MSGSWLETVAEKAGMTPAEAELALRKRGIMANRPPRPARTLTIRRIAFKGEKRGTAQGTIDFDWSQLTAGVWAVTSQRNLRGKSTVLEILLWALRGRPKGLQDDVRRWLSWVCVEFDVDAQRYVVEFAVEERVPRGSLARRRMSGETDELDRFISDEGFDAAMSRFMMNTLDLDPITAMQGKEDERQVVEHGWAALSGGLYFGGDHKQLLGDVQMAGLPARMLQMYIGIPWATTLMQTGTVKRELEQEAEKLSKAVTAAARDAETARARIDGELRAAKKILDSFAPPQSISFWALPRFIATLRASGFSAQRHLLHWHGQLAAPLLFCAMALIGASFSMRHSRFGGLGAMAFGAVMTGFAFYFFNDVSKALGASGAVPAMLGAWAPPLAAAFFALGLLLNLEDG